MPVTQISVLTSNEIEESKPQRRGGSPNVLSEIAPEEIKDLHQKDTTTASKKKFWQRKRRVEHGSRLYCVDTESTDEHKWISTERRNGQGNIMEIVKKPN